jgi:hypothetical protein
MVVARGGGVIWQDRRMPVWNSVSGVIWTTVPAVRTG